jgi:transcriptional regulator with XRE-family HTH domain
MLAHCDFVIRGGAMAEDREAEDCEADEPPGLWLRRRRESAGLTQEELAELAGIATRTISNLESDRIRRPHPRSLRLVAQALGLSDRASGELQARFQVRAGDAAGQPPDPGAAVVTVPRQLPLTVLSFAGRVAEIARLDLWLGEARGTAAGPAIFGISGMAGVGKTALALHWAHRVAGEFPDGQLHVSLDGRGPGQADRLADVAEALGGFLVALGVGPGRVPATLPGRQELYRRLVAERRMLISIDNAKDTAQVRALAPAAAGCVVVMTSRMRLAELAGPDNARLLNLDVPEEAETAELLSGRLGADRVRAEPQAVRELIALCGRLPLALVIVAARAAVSGWRLSVLAAELADARQRLDALDLGDSTTDLRSVFSWSCQQLSPHATRLLRLVALHPGPEFSALAAARLAGMPTPQAQASLRELAHASLICEHRPGRYRLHDLLRLYVVELARAAGSGEPQRDGLSTDGQLASLART